MADKSVFQTVTESIVSYYCSPKAERIAEKEERKKWKEDTKPPIVNKWFGILPMSIKYYKQKNE
ncbi:hypothetical protein J2T56_002314 [Natronobacillus azotifigens]|uniref:YqzE family protein n=1 Tax=Natronobacillus azotifigens TaxID=472978 RepID=A0A9J6REJ4_9BACI|nr:YqzE family protein [Natronobacillus azotifigens]MCZ0704072.1 YqzE family protein [Natronobacillus azotifigens]